MAIAWLVLAAVAGGLLIAGLSACGGADEPVAAAGALARVNGSPVTQAHVDDVRAEARLAGKDDDAEAALDEAIGRELVRQEAERLGLSVEDAAVDERVAAVTERIGGAEALAQALEGAAMSAAQLRRGAAHGLLRQKLRDERFGDLAASDTAVRAFYLKHLDDLFTEPAAVRLGSILLRTKHLATDLAVRIRAGEGFDELARMYSSDPESKNNGGMLGWVVDSSLPTPLRRAARALKKGAVSAPVEGPGGWFLLKLYGRRATEVRSFASVEGELRAELDLRKQIHALDRWIAAERKRAEVELVTP